MMQPRLTIDAKDLDRVAREVGASDKDMRRAFSRAISRTGTTLRKEDRMRLRSELDLRAAKALRNRLRLMRFRSRGGRDLGALRLWYGRNAMPAAAFKGRPRAVPGGVEFRGKTYAGAFLSKMGNQTRRRIWEREGRGRLPIGLVLIDIGDQMAHVVETRSFARVGEIFFGNFRREVRARTIFRKGRR